MKIVMKYSGGPSPGVTLVGERASLLELADTLRAKVEQASESKGNEIALLDSAASSGGPEWLCLQVVPDIAPAMKVQKRKSNWVTSMNMTILAVIALILFLALLGFVSLMPR